MTDRHDGDFVINRESFEPGYLTLYRSGELAQRVKTALAALEECQVCPRNCGINRLADETAGTAAIMQFIAAEISPDTYVNIMPQYYPAGKVSGHKYADINRRLTNAEFENALEAARAAGLWRFDIRRSYKI